MTKANEQTEEMKDIQSEKDKEDHKKNKIINLSM